MDASIRKLLANAENHSGGDKNLALQQAYTLLRNVAETRPAVDAPESFGQDLYVLCAEFAFQNGQPDMAKECLKMFFMKQPASNQFLCRAYLCQAQLMAPQNANNPEQLEKAVVYILKAISFAKKAARYHFLVYNASVIYWQFCRPFLKPGFRQYLARSLHQVVKGLDDIDDKDYEWRAQLMIALIECHLDANRRSDASHIASAAASFIKTNVPSLYKTVFGLMVRHQLVESAKLHKDLKTSPELAVFYKICKLKNSLAPREMIEDASSLQSSDVDLSDDATPIISEIDSYISVDQDENRDYAIDIQNILNQMGVAHKQSLLSRSQERLSRKDVKQPGGTSSSSSPSRDEQELDKKERYSKSPGKGGRRTPTPTTTRKVAADSVDNLKPEERPLLLLELARLCLELDLPQLATACTESMKLCTVKEAGFHLELEFVQCDLMVRNLADKQETYQKSVVDTRLQAIKRCEEAIMNALRLGDPSVIQVGCVTQWNLCLPLLQPNLRHSVRRPLTLVTEALENIDSLLIQLRCQIHTELARCEEDQEQIQVAMENLKKALALDDGNVYHERLEVSLRRLELRAQLYKQPDRPEDQAAMIIEQARKADSGTIRMKRSLLVKAGEALAPDAFLLVLDSENDTKAMESMSDVSSGKGPLTKIRQLAGKAYQFNNCVKKAEGHLKRLGDENDRERARLWGDLAKTARKQEVWDVCRVASRFCLLYDDARWTNVATKRSDSPKPERNRSDTNKEKDETDGEKRTASRGGSRPSTPQFVPLYDKDLIRMMAEVTFINGEALVQLLRSENVQLNDKPVPPEDKSKHPKGYIAKKPEEDPDWIEYCEWIKDLSDQATANFLRGLALGVELDEPWIVCSAAAYLWNYNTHLLKDGRHREIVPQLTSVLAGLKKVGHAGETVMLVNICNALAQGLIKPWLPEAPKEAEKGSSEAGDLLSPKGKGGKAPAATAAKTKSPGISISPDAMPDLKKAIEVCDFVMQVTNGDCPRDVVPIFMRLPILQTWVRAKQMAQQQVSKHLGTDDESNTEGQRPLTRAIVAVEMLSLTKNGIMEFKEVPVIGDIAQMIEDAKWNSEKFVELQLWTRLTYLAYEARLHNMVIRCSKKALRFAGQGTQPRTRKMDLSCYAVEQEMLSYASVLLGQSLVDNMKGKNSLRREAMEAFLNSAKYARSAGNYELVMTAARHFWNTCIPLVGQPIERELLKEPLKIILECIAATADKAKKEEKPPEDSHDEEKKDDGEDKEHDDSHEKDKKDSKEAKAPAVPKLEKPKESEKVKSGMIGKPEDDLTLRAAMYGVLFQSYADQGEWLRALESIDQAVADMPRTKHRLLIFKHRVMVKAKLGRSVHMDIQKFKDESEDYVAQMWRRVALSSKEAAEQLASYQSAIESLEHASNDYQKVEYLLEFGQWMYSNHFSLGDVQDQLEWAIDILLNMKSEEEIQDKEENEEANEYVDVPKPADGKKGKGSKKRAPSAAESKSSLSKGKKAGDKEIASFRGKSADKDKGAKKPQRKDSARSKASSGDRKTSRPPGKTVSMAGSHAQDSRSEISDQDSEINAMDYVPVVREADIGLMPANTSLTVNDLTVVRQLDALIRAHTLLAEIHGQESEQHKDILLMAHSYLVRLWQVLINACGSGIKEIVKNGGVLIKEEPPKSGKGAGGGKDKKDDKDKKKEEKPKPKRKCPVDAIPTDLETWATYDWPDEGIEAFKMDSLKNVALTQENIPKPMLTLYYTDSLITQLCDAGYNHLSLPVLAFQDLLSRTALHSNALFKQVHLRSLEICQELDIKSGSAHHLRILGSLHICEEDQAISRDEIAQWKEKQIQVAKEEQRVKEALSRMTADSPSRPKAPISKSAPGLSEMAKGDVKEIELHLGKVLGNVSLRDVWTNSAEILIRQGYYQRAREYLNEANIATEAFSDTALRARIRYLLAKLACQEAQYGQAINFCLSAQDLKEGDEKFWFETVTLLAEATIKEKYDIKNVRKAKKIIVHAMNQFSKVGDENPNRKNMVKFICAKLEAMLLKIHLDSILHSQIDVNKPKVLKALLDGCERYESITEHLIALRCWRDAVPVYMEHARLLKLLAQKSLEQELRRVYYIQCIQVMRQAVATSERSFTDVHTLYPVWEMKSISTPVQRELAQVKIEMGDVLTDILVIRDKELRHKQQQEERKLSITRLVEEFISEPPIYDDMEKQWMELGRIAADEAMSALLSAHNMGGSIPKLKAESLVCIGRLLRVVSEHHGPDPQVQWMVHDVEVLKMQLAAEEAEAEAAAAEAAALEAAKKAAEAAEDPTAVVDEDVGDEDQLDQDNDAAEDRPDDLDEKAMKQKARYTQQMKLKQKQQDTSKFFFMCASECLAQGLNFCLQNHIFDLAAKASLEMITLLGQYDPPAASMMLSLFQSCQASVVMEDVLFKSQPDPMTSKLAALLHKKTYMLQNDVVTNLSSSALFKDLMTSLHADWQAWKRLEVSTNHLDLLKDIPSNYNLIILQHSPDKKFLYGAVLDKPKGAGPTGGGASKGKGHEKSKNSIPVPKKGKDLVVVEAEVPDVSRARVFGTHTEFAQLELILAKLHEHKHKVQSMLLKKEYQRTQAAQRKNMLEGLEEEQKASVKRTSESNLEDLQLEEEFQEIVGAMNKYLRPVLEPVCHSLRQGNTPLGSNPNIFHEGGGKEKEKASKEQLPQNECAILLVDSVLMQLPLEASQYLQLIEGVSSVSRDFSLQFLYNRMQDDKQVEADTKESKDGKKKAPKEVANVVSRIPGLREAKQKQAKIIPLDRQPQGWQNAVNTMDFRYIVDPNLECAETEPNKPIEEFNKILEKYEQQFTPRWLGVAGDDHTPSVGEWEIYLTEGSSFIFYGLERLLSYVPPHKMAALNIPECNVLLSFDLAETSKSFQRQSKLDVLKTPLAISLESPVEAAMLASLGGIRCVIGNQWHCTLAENTSKINAMMSHLLAKGKTTGQAVYMLQNPLKVLEEEKATQKMAEATAKDHPDPPAQRKKSVAHERGSAKGDHKSDHKSEAHSESTKEISKPAAEADPDKDVEEAKGEDPSSLTRCAMNTVCYGMPNFIINQ